MYVHTVNCGQKLQKELNEMREQMVNVHGQRYFVTSNGDDSLPVVVFLHGFTGSSMTWQDVSNTLHGKYRVIAVDLLGHGQTSAPTDSSRYEMDVQLADVDALFDQLGLVEFILVGYSMGGRIALSYVIHYPKKVLSLVLESASPGLKTETERMTRKEADAQLARRIKEDGIPAFVGFWEEIALFSSQKLLSTETKAVVRTERLNQCAEGLSNSLLGIGTGSQPSNWEKLDSIHVPVLCITGEIDEKFVTIAQEMKRLLPNCVHTVVKDAGHAIHVEKPGIFATMVEEHITKVIKSRGSMK